MGLNEPRASDEGERPGLVRPEPVGVSETCNYVKVRYQVRLGYLKKNS